MRRRRSGIPRIAHALLIVLLFSGASSGRQPAPTPGPAADTGDVGTDPKQPADKIVVVEGQITDHIGAGQVGVTVTVRRKVEGAGEGELIGTATTNHMGDFVVTVPDPVHGDIVVTLEKPDYVTLTRELHVGDGEFPPYLAETLEGKLVLIGRVVDSLTTKPVADASINLRSAHKDWYAESDELGRFTIRGVFPGKGELFVEATGYGRERELVVRMEDFGEVVVRLKPERIVHLKTVDDLGKPIAGVTIESNDEPRDDFRTTLTDENGLVTLRGFHFDATTLDLRLTHEAYVSDEAFDRKIVTPETEPESTHELVMVRAGRISGQVTDAGTGTPLSGARVMTGGDYTDMSPRDWADYKGLYTIRGVKPGDTIVTVHLSDYAPDLKRVEVKASQTSRLDIQLGPGAVLKGIVKSDTGEPISGAFVDTGRWRGHSTLGLRARTGADGRFVIDSAPHDEFEISVGVRGTESVTRTVRAGGDETIEITLSGAVTDLDRPGTSWLRISDTAPVLKVTTLTGETLNFRDLKGKTILLDFWATWCAPCVVDLPHFLAVHERFGARKDFVGIGISLDEDEKVLRDFIKKHKMSWHQVFGEGGGAGKAADRYGVRGIPAVFLIGPDGKLVAVDLPVGEIVKKVEQVLKDNDPT